MKIFSKDGKLLSEAENMPVTGEKSKVKEIKKEIEK